MSKVLTSLLDNDFYKFTMQCGVVQLFPKTKARYTFINRGKHEFPEGFDKALRAAVDAMADLKLTKDEKAFLVKNCPYLSPLYLDFLEGYRYDPSEVHIAQEGSDLKVTVEGHWYRTILWEVPLLSIISELYYQLMNATAWTDAQVIANTREKELLYKELGVVFAEFGTRRRHSYHVHDIVMRTLLEGYGSTFMGSSNVHFAMKYKVKSIGTHAHVWFMFHAAEYSYKMANALSLEHWVDVYRGDLGVALSDTYTTDVFFKLSKYIIFSDGLNPKKVQAITEACKGKIGISFGIGTDLTNDVGLRPMNIVMKLTEVLTSDDEWVPTVKLSDEPNKHTGDPKMIALAKGILGIE